MKIVGPPDISGIAQFIESPQDQGKPSLVPYSLIVQRPSADLNQDGVEKQYLTLALVDIRGAYTYLPQELHFVIDFIWRSFEQFHAYRVEIVVADWSFKALKHPNNP